MSTQTTTARDAVATVTDFLEATAAEDIDLAGSLITDDIAWHNTWLPTIRGGTRVRKILAGLARPAVGFGVVIHHIAADGNIVLTERTDILRFGPVNIEFWVCGTFELRDGRIAVWDDHFDVLTFLRGTVVGVLRAVLRRS
ncbi:limonene-1,2-epoxide hydrolase [Rhodococcus rhodochrous J3]|jgi:limonene-1,2-epoxide hydrolase|uniref:Limonene-1,2-epoxide hydrolase n=1 Tax=Rhodococcus rhodochrous J3 TaxID=903528 RepID=A0ABY1M9N2_RHORH|nr:MULTISPECIES: limonene-1,2-epoxide hydrolase family protein [Rhodococcus]MBF4481465.1 nuclear transport factor 2 family protein [Rhodococcus rhodochrous]MCD2096473.1 nuclear transport factor 2 family protein [Rhodococcus rhodochrous]MCD2121309.1 nuclear transport factor 2 family protein [Rhodococcus rhodochrous]MCQ4136878.1 nuclear transport factor 2 family protein [Rhodococcus rhodochrous]MDC3727010.1 nuclear transport factor 2 family protein [Rhodococcus sp. Rp3]